MPSRVLELLRCREKRKPICSCPLVTCTLEQMEYAQAYYPQAHVEQATMAKLAEAAYRFVGFEGVRVPFDLCVEAEALGCAIKPGDDETPPSVNGPAFGAWEELFFAKEIFERGRFPVVEGALGILQRDYRNEIPIYAGIAGPLTLTSYLFGVEKVLKGMIREPEKVSHVLLRVAELNRRYAKRLADAGANVLMLNDPMASGDLISAAFFRKFLLPAYQRIREMVSLPVILHICGNTNHFLTALAETGFEGFSFEGPVVSVGSARKALGGKMALVGNISTTETLLLGDLTQVVAEVKSALEQGIDIVAPSCGIPVRAPLANLRAMVQASERYS